MVSTYVPLRCNFKVMICQPDQTNTRLGVCGQYVLFFVMIDVRDHLITCYVTKDCSPLTDLQKKEAHMNSKAKQAH